MIILKLLVRNSNYKQEVINYSHKVHYEAGGIGVMLSLKRHNTCPPASNFILNDIAELPKLLRR